MSKYRIVKHRAGDSIGYCPEVWECRVSIGKCQESWWKLAGNENLTSLDLWVKTLPKTIEDAKDIIENHIEDQKPKYSEEVVYEYDTKNSIGMINKEPLEETAERLYPIILEDDGWDKNKQYRDEWIEGAKWQQERMFTGEEVKDLLTKYLHYLTIDNDIDADTWFEQYKKK